MPRTTLLLVATVLTIAAGGCSKPTVPPTDQKPEPQATELRDAMQAPINRAKAVEGVQKAAEDARRTQIDAGGGRRSTRAWAASHCRRRFAARRSTSDGRISRTTDGRDATRGQGFGGRL